MRLLQLALVLCGGCAREQAPPPDPVEVERLLVRLDAQQAYAETLSLSGTARDKLDRAERLVAPLEKVQPDKVDPELAAALIVG